MRPHALVLAGAALCALSVSASATDAGWYLGLGAGLNQNSDATLSGAEVAALNLPGSPAVAFNPTWRGTAIAGYGWSNHLRLEGEFGYSDAGLDKICVGSTCEVITGHDAEQMSLMANLLYDAPIAEKWFLTFGGGAGYAWLKEGETGAYKYASALTWQAIGGVTYKVSSSLDLQLDYRYSSIHGLTFGTGAGEAKIDLLPSNNLMLSVRWYVGPDVL